MINIKENKIYIKKYKKIISINENLIVLLYTNKKTNIHGNQLQISYLSKDDIEIIGDVSKVEFYE